METECEKFLRKKKNSPGWPSPTDSDVKRKQSAAESGSLGKPFSWPFIFLSAHARFAIKLALARLVGLRRRAVVARGLGIFFFLLFYFIFHGANVRLTAHTHRNDKPALGGVLVSADNADRGSARRRAYEPGQLLERLPGISVQPMLLLSTDHVVRRGRGPIDRRYFLGWK